MRCDARCLPPLLPPSLSPLLPSHPPPNPRLVKNMRSAVYSLQGPAFISWVTGAGVKGPRWRRWRRSRVVPSLGLTKAGRSRDKRSNYSAGESKRSANKARAGGATVCPRRHELPGKNRNARTDTLVRRARAIGCQFKTVVVGGGKSSKEKWS